jgi:hypothetical protein
VRIIIFGDFDCARGWRRAREVWCCCGSPIGICWGWAAVSRSGILLAGCDGRIAL